MPFNSLIINMSWHQFKWSLRALSQKSEPGDGGRVVIISKFTHKRLAIECEKALSRDVTVDRYGTDQKRASLSERLGAGGGCVIWW